MFIVKAYKKWAALQTDWPNLEKYREANRKLQANPDPERIVFMGDSITEMWAGKTPFFDQHPHFINRGISGQTTSQMLIRFRQDVIHLQPLVVVILAGTNDIAGNTGPASTEMILNNLQSMVELAQAHQIRVVLCSVLPVYRYPWAADIPAARLIVEMNALLKSYAQQKQLTYVDYHLLLADARGGLTDQHSDDGVHPTVRAYTIMEPLIIHALNGQKVGA